MCHILALLKAGPESFFKGFWQISARFGWLILGGGVKKKWMVWPGEKYPPQVHEVNQWLKRCSVPLSGRGIPSGSPCRSLWMDQGFWYDREKQSKRQINEMQLLGTMTSGRQLINQRIQSKFHLINVTFPSDVQVSPPPQARDFLPFGGFTPQGFDFAKHWSPLITPPPSQVKKIFSCILGTKLDAIEDFRLMIDQLVQATVEVS